MSCILGVVFDKTVYMCCDSISGNHDHHQILAPCDSKVFQLGLSVVGCAGSARYCNLVKHIAFRKMKWLPDGSPEDTVGFLVREFVPRLVKAAEKHGLQLRPANDDDDDAGEILIGLGGNLFHIGPDLAVEYASQSYYAIGIGASYALGSFYESRERSRETTASGLLQESHIAQIKYRMRRALEAAEHFCPAVKKPFVFDFA